MALHLNSTVIVSVYKSVSELEAILFALEKQSRSDFEIIVSEDGESEQVAEVVSYWKDVLGERLAHTSQPDLGFRKNRALNRSVNASRTERLIFIDGDCVPGKRFVEAHGFCLEHSSLVAGRRVELGPKWSDRLISDPSWSLTLSSTPLYLALLPSLVIDGVKNPESGITSKVLHKLHVNRYVTLVGCNFSCSKDVLESINGFNEDYQSPGLGEDSDLQARFEKIGILPKSGKFLTPIFHLSHPRNYLVSPENIRLYEATKSQRTPKCVNGLNSRAGVDCVRTDDVNLT